MLKIRLRKNTMSIYKKYDIILSKSLSNQNYGKALSLGYYKPHTKIIKINKKLFTQSLYCGAQPTNVVRHLIKNYLKK